MIDLGFQQNYPQLWISKNPLMEKEMGD